MRARFSEWLQKSWIALGVIGLLTFFSYSNSFHNSFTMDDYDFIVNWPLIQDWGNLPKFFFGYVPPPGQEGIFSPLKTLVHAVNYHLFGLDPFGHHVFAFANYFAAIVIVYYIGLFFLKDRLSTFLCALLFALHPVHIEYVSSLTGSVDALGVNLMFLSFYFYIRGQKEDGRLDKGLYQSSFLLALASIYLHELCIVLPVMFLWYDLCFLKGKTTNKKILFKVLPFFLLSASYVAAKYLTLGSITRGSYLYDSFYLTMLVIVKAWAKYVLIMFFPATLTFNHVISRGIFSFDQEDFDRVSVLSQSIIDPQALFSLCVLGGIAYFTFKNYKRSPLITFCVGWFFLGLLPGANIVPSGIYFAERYLYPGSLGFCILFGLYVGGLLKSDRYFLKMRVSALSVIAVVILTVVFGGRIWVRNLDMRDDVSLYESAVRANPQSALMRTDLGLVYTHNQMPDKAIESFKKALKIRPDDPATYFSMAQAYMKSGDNQAAQEALKEAILLDPEYAEAHYNLAGIYAFSGEKVKARKHLNKAVTYFRRRGEEEKARHYERLFKEYFRLP